VNLRTLLDRHRRIRTVGIDDGPFERGSRRRVLVVGAVYSSFEFEGLLTTSVTPDGCDATARLARMIAGSKFHAQLHLVMLDGITLGGFNVVDLPDLAEAIGLPCVAVMRRSPDLEAVNVALSRLSRAAERRALMDRAGPIHRAGVLAFQAAGVEPAVAASVLAASVLHGHVPECLRAAHLIASGIATGQSSHRA
jgi:endonuclease V-like protein UPF0215 family